MARPSGDQAIPASRDRRQYRLVSEADSGSIHVYRLENANAEEMAQTLNGALSGVGQNSGRRQPTQGRVPSGDFGGVGGASFEGNVRITHDAPTNALVVLTLCTVGFTCAGLILILLVGRASMDYHEQWRRAVQAAGDAGAARDLLDEVIEALPAGVVVYDADERLRMFNTMAQQLTPALREPGAFGKTYEELANDTASRRATPSDVACNVTPHPLIRDSSLYGSVEPMVDASAANGYTTTASGAQATVAGDISVTNLLVDVLIGDQ